MYGPNCQNGRPERKRAVEWPAWDKTRDQYLYISEALEIKSDILIWLKYSQKEWHLSIATNSIIRRLTPLPEAADPDMIS